MGQGGTESGRFGPGIGPGRGGSTAIEWVWFGAGSEYGPAVSLRTLNNLRIRAKPLAILYIVEFNASVKMSQQLIKSDHSALSYVILKVELFKNSCQANLLWIFATSNFNLA